MKNRIIKWFKFYYVKYIPSTTKIAALEAKRLSKFICENYDENQQKIIKEEIENNIIEYRRQQIINQQQLIIDENKRLERLQNNLITLINYK